MRFAEIVTNAIYHIHTRFKTLYFYARGYNERKCRPLKFCKTVFNLTFIRCSCSKSHTNIIYVYCVRRVKIGMCMQRISRVKWNTHSASKCTKYRESFHGSAQHFADFYRVRQHVTCAYSMRTIVWCWFTLYGVNIALSYVRNAHRCRHVPAIPDT